MKEKVNIQIEICRKDKTSEVSYAEPLTYITAALNSPISTDSGMFVDSNGRVIFDHFSRITETTTTEFLIGDVVQQCYWENYEKDIKTIAGAFPEFDFYYIITDTDTLEKVSIKASGDSFKQIFLQNFLPKQIFEQLS